MIDQIYTYFTIEIIFLWLNLGVLPFWLILVFFPQSQICRVFITSIFLKPSDSASLAGFSLWHDDGSFTPNTLKTIWKDAYKLPIRWMIIENESMPKYLNRGKGNTRSLRAVFQRAFKLWGQETRFNFVEVSDEKTAEIRISFEKAVHGDGFNFDGNTLGQGRMARK